MVGLQRDGVSAAGVPRKKGSPTGGRSITLQGAAEFAHGIVR